MFLSKEKWYISLSSSLFIFVTATPKPWTQWSSMCSTRNILARTGGLRPVNLHPCSMPWQVLLPRLYSANISFPVLSPFRRHTQPSLPDSPSMPVYPPELLLQHHDQTRHIDPVCVRPQGLYIWVNFLQSHNSAWRTWQLTHHRWGCEAQAGYVTCQDHMTCEWQNSDMLPGHLALKPMLLTTTLCYLSTGQLHPGVITTKHKWGQLPRVHLWEWTLALFVFLEFHTVKLVAWA